MRCPRCQEENPPELAACHRCGATLTDPFAPPFAPLQDPSAPRPPAASAEDEAVATIIPYKNAAALTAYYLGLFSCLPLLGLPMAIIALWLGIKGLRHARANPRAHGTAHAWVGLVCGAIGLLINLAITAAVVVGLVVAAAGPPR